MSYRVQIVDNLADLEGTAWATVTAGQPFRGLRWLQFADHIIKNFRPVCLILYDADRAVGVASFALSNDPGVTIASALGRRLINAILGRYPMLLCQTPIANAPGLVLPAGDEIAAFKAINGAIRTYAPRKQVSFMAFGWLSPDQAAIFERTGAYHIVSLDSGMILPLHWAGFEDYHKSLSRTMRRNIKRHDKAAQEMGLTLERTHQFAQYTPRLLEMGHNVWAHHGNSFAFPYRDDMFITVERELPDNSIMILARIGEKIVGSGLLLWDNGVMIWAMLGLDYDYRYVYFQIIYEAIRVAIDLRIKAIHGGTGAYEYKRRLGFQETPSRVAVGASLPLLRWIVARIGRTVVLESDFSTGDDERVAEKVAENVVELSPSTST